MEHRVLTPSEELELRKRQLRARDGKAGYKANCEALRARIAELEKEISDATKVG